MCGVCVCVCVGCGVWCVCVVYASSLFCWSRLRITCRSQMPAHVGTMVQIPAEDAPRLWHDVQIPAWVALVFVMAVLLEIFVIWIAFTFGMHYQRRSSVRTSHRGLPSHMLKCKTGDRLHVEGCVHLQQSQKDDTVSCFQVCHICRTKSKQM